MIKKSWTCVPPVDEHQRGILSLLRRMVNISNGDKNNTTCMSRLFYTIRGSMAE